MEIQKILRIYNVLTMRITYNKFVIEIEDIHAIDEFQQLPVKCTM